jgi:hypothetical protein
MFVNAERPVPQWSGQIQDYPWVAPNASTSSKL